MKKITSLFLIFFLVSCTSVGRFGAGVDITFDPRTVGMQIDTMFGSGKLVEQRLDGFDVVELKHWQLTGSSKVVVYFKTSRNVLLENRKY